MFCFPTGKPLFVMEKNVYVEVELDVMTADKVVEVYDTDLEAAIGDQLPDLDPVDNPISK